MTAGRRDTTPRWSPDGRRLGFLRVVESEGRPAPAQVYALSLDGGEPTALTSMPEGVTTFDWAPDGRNSSSAATCGAPSTRCPSRGVPVPATRASSSRARFRADGTGYLDAGRRSRLFFVTLRDEPRQAWRVPAHRPGTAERPGCRVVGRWLARLLHRRDRRRARLRAATGRADGGGIRWRTAQGSGGGRRRHLAPVAQPGWHSRRLHRLAQRAAGAVVQPARPASSSIARRARSPISPSGTTTTSAAAWRATSARHAAAAPRARSGPPTARRSSRWRPSRAARTWCASTRPAARSAPITDGDHEVQGFTATRDGQAALLSAAPTRVGELRARTSRSARRRSSVLAAPNDGADGDARPGRARDVLDAIVRRHADPGLDSQTTRLRSVEAVPADPADPRRAARRLRRDVHPRVPVDGRQGLRRACTPTRAAARRYGQHFGNSIQHRYPATTIAISWRRSTRSSAAATSTRAPGRHRRQRRRTADQLGAHPHDALCGRRLATVDRRLGSLVVLGRLHAVHAELVQGPTVAGAEGLRAAIADRHTSTRSRRR